MGLFSKSRVLPAPTDAEIWAWSRNLYDTQVFGDLDWAGAYAEVLRKNIGESDPTFLAITSQRALAVQLRALRLEVVGLVVLHRFGLDVAVSQSIYTQRYLHKTGRESTWNDMEPYTLAVAASVELEAGKARAAHVLRTRMDEADRIIAEHQIDPSSTDTGPLEAIGKAVNRNGSADAWKSGRTAAYLAVTLWKQLNGGAVEPRLIPKAEQELQSVVRGLYEGSGAALSEITSPA